MIKSDICIIMPIFHSLHGSGIIHFLHPNVLVSMYFEEDYVLIQDGSKISSELEQEVHIPKALMTLR